MYCDRCHISEHSLKKLSKIDIFMLVSILEKKSTYTFFKKGKNVTQAQKIFITKANGSKQVCKVLY